MPNIAFAHRFLSSLAFTCLVETAVLYVLVRYVLKRRDIAAKDIMFAGLLASFATLPYVWFVFPNVAHWPGVAALYVSEVFVFILEAIIYRFFLRLSWKNSFAVSFICNVASYLLGPALRSAGLWIYW